MGGRTCALTALCAALSAGPALGSSTAPRISWTTDQPVSTVAQAGNTVYFGGSFTQLSPRTGPGVALSASDGTPDLAMPAISGLGAAAVVRAVAPDGSGGWYVGGSFGAVGGVPRANLAHIRADHSVDPSFAPDPDGEVDALAVAGSTVYAGGQFASVAGQPRRGLVALAASTGAPAAWQDDANGPVRALALAGGILYAGGDFTTIGGRSRGRLAAIAATSGAVTGWNPSADGPVLALAPSGTTLYAGGSFGTIGGQTRSNAAALSQSTGAANPWNPAPSGPVHALAVTATAVYVGGAFDHLGGQPRANVGAVDRTAGVATPWLALGATSSGPGEPPGVDALAVAGPTVYVGGTFSSVGSLLRRNLAAVDAATGTPTPFAPEPDGSVHALAVAGGVVFAGGEMATAGPRTARNRAAAIDATTGALLPFDPNVDTTVNAIAVSGTTVYLGGPFASVGGKSRPGLAAVDATTGVPTPWVAKLNCPCFHTDAIVATPGAVYAGGLLDRVDGVVTDSVVALDPADGSLSWRSVTTGPVIALAQDGANLDVGGYYDSIGGTPRANLASLDAASGAVTAWNPAANGNVSALLVSGATTYAGGNFTSIGGQPRGRIAGLGPDGAADGLATGADNVVDGIGLSGGTLYVAGWFSSLGGMPRHGVGGIDLATGAPTAFAPDPRGAAWSLAVAPDGAIDVGSDTGLDVYDP